MLEAPRPGPSAGKQATDPGHARTDLDPDESNIFGPDTPNTREDDLPGGQVVPERRRRNPRRPCLTTAISRRTRASGSCPSRVGATHRVAARVGGLHPPYICGKASMSKATAEGWTVHHGDEFDRREAMARNLERLAWLMDRAFHIPGTRIRVGLDALLGLLPVGGDLLTGVVQVGLVLVALRHYKVPRTVAARMAGNVLLDVAVRAIPLLGDLFDIGFKANTRNIRLLDAYRHPEGAVAAQAAAAMLEHRSIGMPWRFILPIAAVLLLVLALVLVGFITVVRWLFQF